MENSYKNLHDHALGAIILYCRWGAHTDVRSTFQNKSTNGRGASQFPSHQVNQIRSNVRLDLKIFGFFKESAKSR